MPDFRSFAPLAEPGPSEIILSPEESHHLVRVNRVRAGHPVVVFNGRGLEWLCECTDPDRRAARLKVASERKIPPLPFRIALAQALPKGKTLESIIRKATEIGAAEILPLVTARTEVRLDQARRDAKHDKWEATAIEAAKQSGNSYLPEIAPVQSLDQLFDRSADFDLKLVASLQPGATSLRSAFENCLEQGGKPPSRAVWLIGPEGDFTREEYEAAGQAGFVPVTFGPWVLRCETAATYALSILSYELQSHPGGSRPAETV